MDADNNTQWTICVVKGTGHKLQHKLQHKLKKISQPVLEHVKRAAKKAFILMPTKEPQQSYVNIKQSPFEAFIDFVERL